MPASVYVFEVVCMEDVSPRLQWKKKIFPGAEILALNLLKYPCLHKYKRDGHDKEAWFGR